MAHHVPRIARLGAWVLISEGWYYTVSIMEFLDGKVARETQYFGDPFEPGPSRAQWVERMS
jgi:phosphatidylglycerophosphate synthase